MNKPTILINSNGKEVSVETIHDDILKKHLMVTMVFGLVEALELRMIKLKARIYNAIQKYLLWAAKEANVENPEYGDVILSNFQGTKKISIRNPASYEFTEKLQLARNKIYKYLDLQLENAPAGLKEIVDHVFKVDKRGFINKQNVIGLLQIKIKHPLWNEAMQLITESMVIENKKEYLMFHKRLDNKHGWKIVNLNFSSIEPDARIYNKKENKK